MWIALLTLLLAASPWFRAEEPRDAAAAVAEIERALASTKATESAAGLSKHAGFADPRVVAALAKGLKDARVEVRIAALDALGSTAHADALKALEGFHAAEGKALRKDPRALRRLLIAVARHGKPSSIALLSEGAEAQLESKTIEARILGLANIRDKAAVSALFALADKLGFLEQNTHAESFRLALIVLTGEDRGRSLDAWRAWWRENEKSFTLPRELPALAKADRERWRAFWAPQK